MGEHILFLTGKLAEKSLNKVLASMQPNEFTYEVLQIGINVAGLMTTDLVRKRVTSIGNASRILLPGRCRGDINLLSQHYGIPVFRGPEELKDLPQFFGRKGISQDLSRFDVKIFAEIVDAPNLSIEAIICRAKEYAADGANVIDIGCLPNTPFPHLQASIKNLKREGFVVSVDSVDADDLLRGGEAGADYLLSLKEDTLWVADKVSSIPVLIPNQSGDLDSLLRAMEQMQARGRAFYADPILDPIHFGFTNSIVRYHELRQRFPQTQIMMGVGNITELSDADTTGINALLMGIISELGITAILTTEVSPHARSAVREANIARRVMYAARDEHSLPRDYSGDLMTIHERKPFPDSAEEIAEIAASVKDPSFRIQVCEQGIYVYNRDGLHRAIDPFELFPKLNVEADAGHAFYLGVELARAQIAWQLGKRYSQDQELNWGAAVRSKPKDLNEYQAPGSTLAHKLKP